MVQSLILGGARSGKSQYAESLLADGPALYIATGQPFDGEMTERIRVHQQRRGELWHTIEEPLDLAACLDQWRGDPRPILVDCLTLWISNVMFAQRDIEAETAALCQAMQRHGGRVVLVSNEVGLGLVPETALGRQFRDHQGRVNQRLAQVCQYVVFVAAGLPLILKDTR